MSPRKVTCALVLRNGAVVPLMNVWFSPSWMIDEVSANVPAAEKVSG